MSDETFFPVRPEMRPMIYAYEEDNPKYAGMLKVGFRLNQVYPDRQISPRKQSKQAQKDKMNHHLPPEFTFFAINQGPIVI